MSVLTEVKAQTTLVTKNPICFFRNKRIKLQKIKVLTKESNYISFNQSKFASLNCVPPTLASFESQVTAGKSSR